MHLPRKLKSTVLTFLSVLATVPACTSAPRDSDPTYFGARDREFAYVESYGFCKRACVRELSFDADGAATVSIRDAPGAEPSRTREFVLPPAVLDRLRAQLTAADAETWDANYGCPNCADQGAFALRTPRQETVLDPYTHPAYFDELLAELRGVLVDALQ